MTRRLSRLRILGVYAALVLVGIIIVYPLLWLFFSSFKATNEEIFGSMDLIPNEWTLDSYVAAWKGVGELTLGTFFLNTVVMVVPTVALTVLSSSFVAYGFARFDFPLKKPLFSIMIATLMLPYAVLIIPRYLLFNSFGWIDSYWPFIVPSAFGGSAFFIFLMVQFMRGIPRELDESAKIDGCGSFLIYRRIIMPLCKPALFSVGIFQFVWTWNDFFNSMIFINSTEKFTLSLALRMTFDSASAIEWNKILAMSVLAIIPCVVLFFTSQKYFVEGISTSGLKG
jgi:oligogalacturonide transport system permease protein